MTETSHINSTYDNAFADAGVLITGGAGFIGSHLGARLTALGARVRIIDDLSSGSRSNLDAIAEAGREPELIEASILNAGALERASAGCRFVFHHAAMVSVPESVGDPEGCLQANIVGTQRVLEAARQAGVRRVTIASSAAVYGDEPSLPSSETDPTDCRSPYAAGKASGETIARAFSHCYGLSTVNLRYFNIFGPRQDPRSPYAAVISAFADRLIRGVQPSVFGNGSQTRDFVPVDNVVHANLLAAAHKGEHKGTVCNIGTGRSISLLDLLGAMGDALGVDATPEFAPPRAGDVMHSRPDISRAREAIGYEPIKSFEEGIRETLEWAKVNTD